MKPPNGERAVVPDPKLLEYALNPAHPEGRSHAWLFNRLLGIDASNANILRTALLEAAREGDATAGKASPHGRKYEVRFQMTGSRHTYTVLSVWIVPKKESIPRLVTVFIE